MASSSNSVTAPPSPTSTITRALTTTFTPPTSCFEPTYTQGEQDGHDLVLQTSEVRAAATFSGIYVTEGIRSECYPPHFYLTETDTASPVASFYSPGVIPAGYVSQALAFNGATTYATLCPSLWTLATSVCTNDDVLSATIVDGTKTTSSDLLRRIASPITIAWETTSGGSAMIPTMTSSIPAASSSGASPISGASLPSSTSSSKSTAPKPSGGSSIGPGVQAAIGLAITFGLITLLMLGGLLWKRRKNRKQDSDTKTAGSSDDESLNNGKAELPGDSKIWYTHSEELDNDAQLHEANGIAMPPEMDNNVLAELEGDWAGWEAPTPTSARDSEWAGWESRTPVRESERV